MSAGLRGRYWSRWLLAAVMAAFMLVGVAGLIAVRKKPDATFNVTVTTERLAFERPVASPRRWIFQGARLQTAGKVTRNFTGSLQLDKPARGFIERIGEGPLWVHIDCAEEPAKEPAKERSCDSVGRLFGDNDALHSVAGPTMDIWIDDVKQAAARGITTVLTLSGTITPGREVGIETLGSTAILRAGSVAVLVETAFGSEKFEARRELLEAGDLFRVVDPAPGTLTDGFVIADERPALTAAYRVSGRRGYRQRPGGGGYDVVATTVQRILHDDFFQMLSWVLVFLAGLAAVGQLATSLQSGHLREPGPLPTEATAPRVSTASVAQPPASAGSETTQSGDR